jgi:hypothetical protein
MKSTKDFIIFLLLLPFAVCSQNITDSASKAKVSVYYGISTDLLRDFNVNKTLEQSDLLGFRKSAFGATIGVNMHLGRGIFNVEGEVKSNWDKRERGQSNLLRYLPASIGYFHRVVGGTETGSIYLGCSYNLTLFAADVYSKNNSIDLTNLAQEDMQGALNLNAMSHGAAFSILLNSETDDSWISGSAVKISYILDLTKPDWKSNSLNLTNSLSENFSRFHITLTRPIKQRK